MTEASIELNGKSYLPPSEPLVVVCIDGGDPEYMEQGIKDGIIPTIEGFMKDGFYGIAQGSMPSFTCPNNMSIVTATEPETNGNSGNFFFGIHISSFTICFLFYI